MNKAFEKILERLEELQNNLLSQTEGDVNLQVGVINGVMYSKKIVQEVAEEYNVGWIACSERLPEESGYYLVTYHDCSNGNFLPKYDDIYVRRLHYQISERFTGWNYPRNVSNRVEHDCHKEVIAWQPLPEPFKESD